MLPSYAKLLIRCAVGIYLGSALWGQANLDVRNKPGEKTEPRPRSNIRVDSTLVLIPVTVTDPMNRFVTGLEKENFKLTEDKQPQEITQFSSEDAPLSVGVVFDCSGSMGHKLEKSRQAVAQFFKLANPEDEFFLVQFNDSANLIQTFTRNLEEIQNKLAFTQSKGRTALLDAVYMAVHEMKKARNPRKAILIISDGGDNSSRYSESEVKNLVKENDVLIYAIGVFEFGGGRLRTSEEAGGPGLLNDLCEQTGGRHLPADAAAETRRALYLDARSRVRKLVFANPLLNFEKLIFIKRFTHLVKIGDLKVCSKADHALGRLHFIEQDTQ